MNAPRFQWRCSRCRRENDEPVVYGWGPAYAKCSSCPQTVDLEVKLELDGGVVRVVPLDCRRRRSKEAL
jgi:hypothetical protein